MWFRVREMNGSNGSIFLDENGALERSPILGFYAMFFWSRLCMFTWDDRLVIHAVPELTESKDFSWVTCSWVLFNDRSIFTLSFLLSPIKNAVVQR